MKEILCEKYRPKTYEEIAGLSKENIELIEKNMPHLLLVGNAGTGKTSLAKVIISSHKFEHLLLNASDERGINTVRNKVKTFASTSSLNGKLKIVFLDEADSLTQEAQDSLRNTMETYQKICRFILTANYQNKIIDALQSRCTVINFSKPNLKEVLKRLVYIVKKEDIKIKKDALIELAKKMYPDMRKMINILQKLSKKDMIRKEDISKEISGDAHEIYTLLKKRNFIMARKVYLKGGLSEAELIKEIYTVMMKDKDVKAVKKGKIISHFAECLKYLPVVAIKQILFEEMMINVMRELNVK